MDKNRIIIAAALAAAATGADAQQVYRCGSSYSQQPCPGGTTIAATDPGGDAARARAAAKVDAQRAAEFEKARLAREKQAPKAIVMAAPAPAQAASNAVQKKPAKKGRKPEYFTAVAPKK